MLRNVFLKSLRDQRRSMTWWVVGLLALTVMLMAMYPTVRSSADQLQDYMRNLPETLKSIIGAEDYTTPTGYLKAELFNFMMPVVFLIFAVGAGGRAIAGEEEKGTLDLLLANPISRRRILVQKVASMIASTTALAVVLWIGIAAGAAMVGAHVGLALVAGQLVGLVLLSTALGSLALAIGCAWGSRGLAAAVSGTVALVTYLLDVLAPTIHWLGGYRKLSPFYYYAGNDPLVHGLSVVHAGVLAGISAVLVLVALVAFERRDLAA